MKIFNRLMLNSGIFLIFFMLLSANLSGLSLDEVLKKIDETEEVKSAILSVESARKQVEMLSYPGNVSVALQPVEKTTASAVSFSGSVSFNIPLGLSEIEKTNLERAEESLELAEKSLNEARSKALLSLYSKYQTAWLAQKERDVIDAEVKYAEILYTAMRNKFESGDISLTELAAAEEGLTKARENAIQGMLARRIAWFELASAVGLDFNSSILEDNLPQVGELPRPPELSGIAYENLSSIQNQIIKIKQIENEIEKLKTIDYTLSFKPFLTYEEHSVSADYNLSIPNLTLSYSFPIKTISYGTTYGNSGTGYDSSDPTWNAGISINLSLKAGKETTLQRDSLIASLNLEESKLRFLKSSVDLNIRSKYQQWILAGDLAKQAERNLERAINNKAILKTKLELGLVGEDSIIEADALIKRAEWNLLNAKIGQEKTRLAVAAAAGYIPDEYKKYLND